MAKSKITPIGDRVLVALAETLREALRTQDVVGRFGGEEFLLVLPATDLTGAWALAERIRRHVDEAVSVSTERGEAIRFNVSIGVAAPTARSTPPKPAAATASKRLEGR
jgi:diguanylate cyclase (GGDEF)-like protein